MKVLYDYQVFAMQRLGGISRYFSILYHSMPQYGVKTSLAIVGSDNIYVEGCGQAPWLKSMYKKNRRLSKIMLRVYPYDVLHPTYYNPYFLQRRRKNKPVVLTVHDMIHERYSQYFTPPVLEPQWKRKVCGEADRLIAISHCTARDMMEIWGIDESRIDVVHHGEMWSPTLQAVPVELPFGGDYLLYVGDRIARYKNFELFARAVAPVLKRYDLHVVCTGRPFDAADVALLRELEIAHLAHQCMVDDGRLLWLYSHAACFVYPSMYEGFGIPILEAFRARCPMLLSRASCFPEIAGDAAAYFDVERAESLTAELCSLLDDTERRETLIARGGERLKEFATEKMIEQTLRVYECAMG